MGHRVYRCTACGACGRPVWSAPGVGVVVAGLALVAAGMYLSWLFFLPVFLLGIYQRAATVMSCAACGSAAIEPLFAPAGSSRAAPPR